MGIKVANNAFGTLATGINSSATSITLTTGQGARFPTLGAGDYFYATLVDTSNNLEIVKVTARSTDVLTVVRAQESTTARAYSAGDRIEIRLTAATFVEASAVEDGEITAAKMAAGAAAGNLGFTPLSPANNLSELSNAGTARSNLGLGALATRGNLNLIATRALSGNYAANTWHRIFTMGDVGSDWAGFFTVYVDTYNTGLHYQELYTGWFGWGNSGTNSPLTDTVYYHRGGHAPNTGTCQFSTERTLSGQGAFLRIQSNETWTGLNSTGGRNVTLNIYRLV